MSNCFCLLIIIDFFFYFILNDTDTMNGHSVIDTDFSRNYGVSDSIDN